jgi:uroporphyrin-3 C-methyltransferase
MTDIQVTTKPRKAVIGPIALIVAVLVGAGMCWNAYLHHTLEQNHHTVSDQVTEMIDQQHQLSEKISLQQTELTNTQSTLNRVRQRVEGDSDTWMLAEIEHLVRLAEYQVVTDHQSKIALRLLQSAERRAQNLHDPAYFPIKQTLANGISAVEATPQVEVEKIILRLNALSKTLGELPISDSSTNSAQITEPDKTDAPTWRQHLQQNLKRLEGVVMIRHLDYPSQALLPPQQHASVIENIQLQMSMASWAVLHQNVNVYQESLDQAIMWIKKYLHETTATAAIVQGLNDLKQNTISSPSPDLTKIEREVANAIASQRVKPVRQVAPQPASTVIKSNPVPQAPKAPMMEMPGSLENNKKPEKSPDVNDGSKPKPREVEVISS